MVKCDDKIQDFIDNLSVPIVDVDEIPETVTPSKMGAQ